MELKDLEHRRELEESKSGVADEASRPHSLSRPDHDTSASREGLENESNAFTMALSEFASDLETNTLRVRLHRGNATIKFLRQQLYGSSTEAQSEATSEDNKSADGVVNAEGVSAFCLPLLEQLQGSREAIEVRANSPWAFLKPSPQLMQWLVRLHCRAFGEHSGRSSPRMPFSRRRRGRSHSEAKSFMKNCRRYTSLVYAHPEFFIGACVYFRLWPFRMRCRRGIVPKKLRKRGGKNQLNTIARCAVPKRRFVPLQNEKGEKRR